MTTAPGGAGEPGGLLRCIGRWLAWTLMPPAILAGLFTVLYMIYLGWDAVAPWLYDQSIDATTMGGILVFFGVAALLFIIGGMGIYK